MFFRQQQSNLLTLGSSSSVGPRMMASAAIENADGSIGVEQTHTSSHANVLKINTKHVTYASPHVTHHPSYTPFPPNQQAPQRNDRVSSMARNPENLSYQLAMASTAITFSGSLSVLSSLTLTAVVIGLVAATPLLVIFSPVLVPAGVAMLLLNTGLVMSGGLGATAAMVFYWVYNYATGQHPVGADKLDQLASTLASGVRSIKN
ncbi:hypothetical protein ACFX19_032586 [Malus domestica]